MASLYAESNIELGLAEEVISPQPAHQQQKTQTSTNKGIL